MSKRLELGVSIVIEHVPDFPPVRATLSIEGVDKSGLKWQQRFTSGGSDEVDAIKMVTRNDNLPAAIASIGASMIADLPIIGADPDAVAQGPADFDPKPDGYEKDKADFYKKVEADLSELKHTGLRAFAKEHGLLVKFANNVSLPDAREMIIAEIRSREA